jgi:hypothetical protein
MIPVAFILIMLATVVPAYARLKPRLSFSQLVGVEQMVLRRKRTTTSTRTIS